MSFLKKKSKLFRIICLLLAFLLVQNNLEQVQAQPTPFIPPGHNYFVDLSLPFSLPVLRGMRVYPAKPFEFDFVIDSGDRRTLDQRETSLLVKYFLTCLTIPEEDLWVNLSPYESGKIIPDELALTNAGNTLLEQDKLLKQLASSLTYPESRLGKKFWQLVYKKAFEKFGTTDLPVNTYNKVWIVPDKAIVYDMGDSALIGETHLKVMLDEDYLAFKKHIVVADQGTRDLHRISSLITKEIILPELEKEINGGKNFAPVRQIFHSMVLAAWFKRALKRNVLSNFYVDKKMISGVDGIDKNSREEIYKQYLRIYKMGAYNYIREDLDPISQQVVPRKYFSGGFSVGDPDQWMKTLRVFGGFQALKPYLDSAQLSGNSYGVAKVELDPITKDPAQLVRSSTFKRILSTVALAITLYSMTGLAQAQSPLGQTAAIPAAGTMSAGQSSDIVKLGDPIVTPADKEAVRELKGLVTIDDVKAIKGKVNPITGEPYSSLDTDNIERHLGDVFNTGYLDWRLQAFVLAFQNKHLIHEDGQLGPETRKVLTEKAAPQVPAKAATKTVPPAIIKAAPRVPALAVRPLPSVPLRAVPAAPAVKPVVPRSNVNSYQVSITVPTTPVEDNVLSRSNGIVTGLNSHKLDYNRGEVVFILHDPQLDGRIREIEGDLGIKTRFLTELKALGASADTQEINQAQQQVEGLELQLAQARQERANGIVRAPHHMRIRDLQVSNGRFVSQGMQLLSYYDLDRVQVEFEVPITVNYFYNTTLTLNGAPVKNIFSAKWSATPSPQKALLSFIVTPSSAITPGQEVSVTANIYAPSRDKRLDPIVGQAGSTYLRVNQVEQYPITASAEGPVEFFVGEGVRVKRGQLLARVDPGLYQAQLAVVDREIGNVDIMLKAALGTDGTYNIPREQADGLRSQKNDLLSNRETLLQQIAYTNIHAPYDGIITWSAQHGAGVFKMGDPLFKEINGTVFLGDPYNNARNYAILFPKEWNIRSGDPVLVQTPDGMRLMGQVADVNKGPHSSTIQLGQVQSVEVKVFDPQNSLRSGLPVQIIMPTDREKEYLKQAMASAVRAMASQPRAAGAPPPPRGRARAHADNAMITITRRGFLGYLTASIVAAVARPLTAQTLQNTVNPPQPYSPPQWETLNIAQIYKMVVGNDLTAGPEAIQVLEDKAKERLPKANQMSLTGDVWREGNGKLYYAGGLQGVLGDVVGGLTTGNAIAAGLPIIFKLAGSIVDHLTHKIDKQVKLAAAITEIAMRHYQTVLNQQVKTTNDRLIDIGSDEQRAAQLKVLLADLNEARQEMIARESGGFSLKTDRYALESKINDVKAQILALQGSSQGAIVEINTFIGRRADLHKPISADLPWIGNFPRITEAQEAEMSARLTSDDGPDPRLQEVIASRKAIGETARLQGLDKLPIVNLTSLYSTEDPNNSLYDFVPGTVMRTSEEKQGANGGLHIEIPIFNQGTKIKGQIIALEVQETEVRIKQRKAELAEELARTIGNIRNLSGQIEEAQASYEIALGAWELKAGHRDLFLPHQFVTERLQMDLWFGKILDLKSQYFKQEAVLRQMGLMKQDESLVKKDQAMTSQRPVARFMAYTGLLTVLMLPVTSTAQIEGQDQGNIPFSQYSPSEAFALMSEGRAGSTNAIVNTLISDPNINDRADALKVFFNEYQNNGAFIKSTEDIIMASPYQDVVQAIFKFMVERKDHDLRFFVQMITLAQGAHNRQVLAMAEQSMEDVLTNDPKVLEDLSPTYFITDGLSYYSQVTPATAKRAFLTFLAQGQADSLAQARFLQSHYWNSEQLAAIYNELMAYANAHPQDAQYDKIKGLAGLIYDAILRDKALENVDEVFSLGDYKNFAPEIFNHSDSNNRVWIQALADQNRRFLNSSRWRDMQDFIKPGLYSKALEITRQLVQSNPASSASASPLNDLSGQPLANIYFSGLDINGQQAYVAGTSGILELARDLQLVTPVREDILDRMMGSRDGRLLVLKVYDGSADEDLLNLIETQHDWLNIIRADAQAAGDPAADLIFRTSLNKMYVRTKQDGLLDVLLGIYPEIELRSAKDPRGDDRVSAQIDKVAGQWALNAINDALARKMNLVAGHTIHDKDALNMRDIIALELSNEIDPHKVQDFLREELSKEMPSSSRALLKELMSTGDGYAQKIRKNDQNISGFPLATILTMSGFSVIVMLILNLFIDITGRFKRNGDVTAVTDKLQKALLRKRKPGEDGYEDKAMIAPSRKDTYRPAFEPLLSWRNVVYQWTKQESYPPDSMLRDLNTVLNNASKVLRLMPYSTVLIWSDENQPLNEDFRASYDYFIILASRTLDVLSKRLQNADLTDTQRQQFLRDKDAMLANMRYVASFLRVLKYRSTIEKVMGYKFSDDDWRDKVYVLVRWYLYYQILMRESEKALKGNIPDLLKEGNLLIPGLYQDPDAIVSESLEKLDDVLAEGRTAYNPQSQPERRAFKERSFYSRALTLVAGPGLLLFSLAGVFTGSATSSGMSSFFIPMSVIALTVFIFWKPHRESLKMEEYKMMTWLIDTLDSQLDKLLDPAEVYQKAGLSAEQKIVNLAKQEDDREVRMELDLHNPPRIDAIVIISEDKGNTEKIKEHVNSVRGRLIRQDIPVEVVSPRFKGSGNAYFDALKLTKENFDSGLYQEQYPHLKPWKDARVMFIFHGEEAVENNTLIDWSIANGYRAAASMSQAVSGNGGSKSGNIIIFSRDVYFGPIEQVPGSDITLLTSRVNSGDLGNLGWVSTSFSEKGDAEIDEILEKVNIRGLIEQDKKRRRGSKTVQFFKSKGYDLENEALKQFTAFNGMVLMGPDAVATNVRIAEKLSETGLIEELPIHLTSDWIIPLLTARYLKGYELEREFEDYIVERVTWRDMSEGEPVGLYNGRLKAKKDSLRELYTIMSDEMKPNIKVTAYVPHPAAEVYYTNITKNGGSDKIKVPGGIDLSFHPQFIQRSQKAGPASIQEANVPMPEGFRGFNFNIVRFTSQLTVNGAFQLMFTQ